MTHAASTACLSPDVATAYAAGRLSRDELASVGEHIDSCSMCRQLLSHAAQLAISSQKDASGFGHVDAHPDRIEPAIGPGSVVNRYVVDSWVGAGGMGVVYAAHDPDLKRKVALKVLRERLGGGARSRLAEGLVRREAMAMARIAHPNVVSIYDLFGTEDALYIVMEFIDGTTLTKWLRERTRSWKEVVSVFTAAGHGLAAAQAEGIIHRDFKPDNVLVATSGRICVSDFGLSRVAADGAMPASSPRSSHSSHSMERAQSAMSMQHAGTPRYMSPEQLSGEPATAKSDQFSFCIALYEALFGEHPFGGREERTGWVVRSAPSGSAVPGWLRKSVLRGLSVDPEARYSTLDALLSDIQEDPRRRRHRTLMATALSATLLAGGLAGWGYQRHAAREACAHFDRSLAGVWDEATKQSFEASAATLEPGRAKDAWGEIRTALGREARAWADGRALVCREMQASGAHVDPRRACLDTRLEEFRALVRELPAAMTSSEHVSAALVAVRKQLSVGSCLTEPGSRPSFVSSERPDRMADAKTAEVALARAVALQWLGSDADSASAAETAVRLEEGAGNERPLALALYLAGGGHARAGLRAQGMKELGAALTTADVVGDDRMRAAICTDLVKLSGFDPHVRSDPTVEADGALWFAEGMAAARRFGDEDGTASAALHDAYAGLLLNLGKYEQGIDEEGLALPAFERGASSEQVATILTTRAGMLTMRGDVNGAASDLQRASALLTAGGDPSRLAFTQTTLASVLIERTDFAQAETVARRALSTLASTGAPTESLDSAVTSDALGEALLGLGRYDESLPVLVRSAETLGRLNAPEEVMIQLWTAVGRAYVGQGHPAEGVPYLERAAHASTSEPASLADAQFALARALTLLGRDPRRARALAAAAGEALDRVATLTPLQAQRREEVKGWIARQR